MGAMDRNGTTGQFLMFHAKTYVYVHVYVQVIEVLDEVAI